MEVQYFVYRGVVFYSKPTFFMFDSIEMDFIHINGTFIHWRFHESCLFIFITLSLSTIRTPQQELYLLVHKLPYSVPKEAAGSGQPPSLIYNLTNWPN